MSYLLKCNRFDYSASPLIKAILDGNNELSRDLITQGADVNARDDKEQTALMCAAFKGNKEIAHILIDAGAYVNHRNIYQHTALFYSIANNKEQVARLLIENRADINVSDADGNIPLFYADENLQDDDELLQLLIDEAADLHISNRYGLTLLHFAAENENAGVALLLIEKGADVNVSDKDGQTPLFNTAKNNNGEVARLLIEKGADVNVSDKDGQTPLFNAAGNNNEEVTRLLIEKDADVNKSDKDRQIPLFNAAKNNNGEVTRLLIEKRADVNVSDKFGQTPLFYAAGNTNEEVARLLIEKGADVNVSDKNGRTPLFYTARNNNEAVARLLIEKGADVNKRDNNGRTALSHVIERMNESLRYESLAQILFDAGANVNLGDNRGQTPLFYAFTTAAVRLLLTNGADFCLRNIKQETAMINAVMKCQSAQQFLDIASILVKHGGVLNDTDSCNVSVLSHFLARHFCKQFTNVEARQIITFFTENGIQNSIVSLSAMNYLYAMLPKYLNTPIDVVYRKGKEILSVIVAIFSTYYQDSKLPVGIEKLKASLSKDKLPECLDILMTLGVDPNSADSYGNTALHYATLLPFQGASQEYVNKVLQTLKQHNVRFNVRNQDNETPLHFCLSERAWELATKNGTWSDITKVVEICQFLLKDHSLICETTRKGETVYHLLMELLKRGLSMNEKEIRDCICSNAVRLLELFSKATCKQSIVLKKVDDKMNSPLHLWASLSLPPNNNYGDHITKDYNFSKLLDTILKHLLGPGVLANPRNEDDQTPLHLSRTWAAIKLLVESEANTNDLDRWKRPPLLNVATQRGFEIKQGNFFPDLDVDPKKFFELCVSLVLDIWSSDIEGQSMLSIFLELESYILVEALIDVALDKCDSTSIIKQLLDAICKDPSTRTTWKSNVSIALLTSSKRPSKMNLGDALRHICTNIRRGSVFVDIGRQLLFYGADGNSLCNDFPDLRSFLTGTISPDQMVKILPWTSHSKIHEDKLKVVSRKQNIEEIGTYCYHKEPIGHGGFGEVYAGICMNDAREVAIKKINRRIVKGQDEREISNLVELSDCQHVVKYISFDVSDKDFVYIVLELMEDHLDNYFASSSFDASRTAEVCRDVVEGLKYLHQHKPNPILHRDLKPENILYKFDTHDKLIIKIADFGLSSPLTTGRTTVLHSKAGTRCWMAPEVLTSKTYEHSTSSDVFSCGLVCHYILSNKKHPFGPADCTNKSDEVIAHTTQDNMLKYQMDGWDHALSPEATHLIKDMLQEDKNQRPSAADSLSHPFFWPNKKKMEFLSAVGNQYEFECPSTIKAARYHVTTGVEAHLENNFTNIVRYAKWDDPNYKNMAKVVAEMNKPIEKVNKKAATHFQNPRTCDTSSIVELVRFIRNAINHVSEKNRPNDIRKLILEEFVFLKEFPHLLIEVYKAVTTTHGWDTREEIKYAMPHEEQKP